RGLRTVDPEEHPGIVKTDCVVLDFGTSSLIHGTLEQDVDLDGKTEAGEAPTKSCPGCGADIPLAATECPLCGEAFPRDDLDAGEGGAAAPLSGFMMTEIDLLKRSSFAWVDLFGDDAALMANGFSACSTMPATASRRPSTRTRQPTMPPSPSRPASRRAP
ncbi:MAG: zinc ribbon domain-containing protein, partial [Thermaurantiacus sp.]